MWTRDSRTGLSALLILLSSALIVSAFAPSITIGSEQAITVETLHSEVNAPTAIMLDGPTDPEEFEAFLDPLVADLMESNHIPGAAITVVMHNK